MLNRKQFHLLLGLSIVFGLTGGAIDFVVPGLIPDDVKEWHNAQMDSVSGVKLWVMSLGSLAVVGCLLPALYGLFRARRWAPNLALAISGVALALCTLDVPYVLSGPAFSLLSLSSFLWGAVLLIAYLRPAGIWDSISK